MLLQHWCAVVWDCTSAPLDTSAPSNTYHLCHCGLRVAASAQSGTLAPSDTSAPSDT